MKKGKDKCKILKKIRKYVAKKYGLDYDPTECNHEGDCKGTCPNCDAELAEGCLACVAEFGVGSKSACFDYDVGHSDYLSFLGFGFLFVCCDYIILCNIPIVKYNFRKFLNFGNAQHK